MASLVVVSSVAINTSKPIPLTHTHARTHKHTHTHTGNIYHHHCFFATTCVCRDQPPKSYLSRLVRWPNLYLIVYGPNSVVWSIFQRTRQFSSTSPKDGSYLRSFLNCLFPDVEDRTNDRGRKVDTKKNLNYNGGEMQYIPKFHTYRCCCYNYRRVSQQNNKI